MCSLKKVCLLDWLIRCLGRVLVEKGAERVRVVVVVVGGMYRLSIK